MCKQPLDFVLADTEQFAITFTERDIIQMSFYGSLPNQILVNKLKP